MPNKALVIDLCGTIVRENTTHGFLLHKSMPWGRRLAASLLLSRVVGALLHRLDSGLQRRWLIRCLSGMPVRLLRQIASAYATAALAEHPRREVLEAMASRREGGNCRIILASASIDIVVEAFAEAVHADGFVATELEYANEYCAGRIVSDSTGRKLSKLQACFTDSSFVFDVITDNVEDTDLMQAAENVWFIDDAK